LTVQFITMNTHRPTTIWQRGILSLIVAQFWGAANDNILKGILVFMMMSGVWAAKLPVTDKFSAELHDTIGERIAAGVGKEALPFLFLALPFLLLSGFAGQVADRHSKRTVMVAVKIAEIPIVIIAGVGLWMQNLPLTLVAMLLLAIQSSFFGPAKYGVIPELVDDTALSRANGFVNMMTNVAIIAGTLLAGAVCDAYYKASPPPDFVAKLWLPLAVLLAIAGFGLLAILPMPRVKPGVSTVKYNYNPFTLYIKAFREMANGPIIIVAIAWAFFQMIGTIALLSLPNYEVILGISYKETSYILGAMGVALGAGSVACGLLSGDAIRPRFVLFGALGMALFFGLLGFIPPSYWLVMTFVAGAGFFAGFYIIPLQALMQKLAPDDKRGQFLGAAGGIAWSFVVGGCLIYWFARVLAIPPERIFIICAVLAITGTVIAYFHLGAYLRPKPTNA
jgi:acyl-[acyl-carrier-protein]-phospholipid O-acyltransferase/long-chain-fatty-acid--[acyl-carrier-protein] ligase